MLQQYWLRRVVDCCLNVPSGLMSSQDWPQDLIKRLKLQACRFQGVELMRFSIAGWLVTRWCLEVRHLCSDCRRCRQLTSD